VAATPRMSVPELLRTLGRFGFGSLLIAVSVSAATGAIIVLETATYTIAFGARDILGGMAGIGILREFGPLMVAMVMSGWVGASNAAELANLTLGGQVSALRGIGADPFEVLIAPRLWGTMLAMALLALPTDLASVAGGMFSAKVVLGIGPDQFLRSFEHWVKFRDVLEGFLKIGVFGAAIGLISTRAGLQTRGGARAVGRSVAASVVQSVVAVLMLDVTITALVGGRL
jgi:phospholipid/cholesterol/gamma-HCH transport system permease protein